jgi:hypothetical protein
LTCPLNFFTIDAMKINIERIDRELQAREWSRYRLAREMGIHPNTLYANLRNGSFKTVGALSRTLEIPEAELVIGE